MKPIRVYLCEDSQAGVFAGIYDAGKSAYGHDHIRLEVKIEGTSQERDLFSEYIDVKPDRDKAEKVLRTIRKTISPRVYQQVLYVAAGCERDKADIIYHYIVYGFKMGAKVEGALQIPAVHRMFQRHRKIQREVYYYREFIRFQEIQREKKVLLAVLEPKNHVLPFIMPHFSDRLNTEWFIMYDKSHGEAGYHDPEKGWLISSVSPEEQKAFDEMEAQREAYMDLWQVFIDTIAIQERANSDLQRNNLPIHFRKHLIEFHSK